MLVCAHHKKLGMREGCSLQRDSEVDMAPCGTLGLFVELYDVKCLVFRGLCLVEPVLTPWEYSYRYLSIQFDLPGAPSPIAIPWIPMFAGEVASRPF